jgi:hypothetical protein
MDQLQTAVMLMTASHRIVGQIGSVGQRLNDILNNKLNTFLKVYNAEIFRHTDAETPIARFPVITLPKALINLILIQEQTHEAPTKRLYGFVQKDVYQTFLTISDYEVQGSLHFTALPKPEIFLGDTTTSFVPVTQATVTYVNDSARAWQALVVFVQRFSIALFHLEERR